MSNSSKASLAQSSQYPWLNKALESPRGTVLRSLPHWQQTTSRRPSTDLCSVAVPITAPRCYFSGRNAFAFKLAQVPEPP